MANQPTRCCWRLTSSAVGRTWAPLATVAAMRRTRFLRLGMVGGKLMEVIDVVEKGWVLVGVEVVRCKEGSRGASFEAL
jgi:hypothetical protein